MVFCRNNSDDTKASFLKQCELRHHKGAKIRGLTRHGSLDKGRVIHADYNTTGAKLGFAVDVVCKTKGGATITYPLASGAKWADGCCRNKQYGSTACCGAMVKPDAGAKTDLPAPPDMVTGSGHRCKDKLSKTYGAKLIQLKAGSSAKAGFTIPNLPSPSGLAKAALVMTLDDADHPGKEGWIRINGKGPLQLPASTAWNNTKVTASAAVPTSYLIAGTNSVVFTSNSSPYGVGNVLLRVWGPACGPKKPDAKVASDQAPPVEDHSIDDSPPTRDQAQIRDQPQATPRDAAAGAAEDNVTGGCSCEAPGRATPRWSLGLLLGLLLLRRRAG